MYRRTTYKKRWRELIDYYGAYCYYCQIEVATVTDHVVPYSWDRDNSIENLVPSCALCNLLASDMMFDSVEHKREYIISKRKKRAKSKCVCTSCLMPFEYRVLSPSFLLCAECYDAEYKTKYSKRQSWKDWLTILYYAGMPPEAHRVVRRRAGDWSVKHMGAKREMLIDEYANYIDSNEEFAYRILSA